MRWIVGLIVAALVAGVALQLHARWPREFADSNRAWDMPGPGDGLWVISRGAQVSVAVPGTPGDALERADAVIRSTPRTRVVSGSREEGRVTYLTRTAFWGFPDLTTVEAVAEGDGARLNLRARQRIGSYDWGVNRARLEGWLGALGVAVPPDRTDQP